MKISPDLEALIMRALSPAPAGRPSSAEQFRDELLACAVPETRAGRTTPPQNTVVLDSNKAYAQTKKSSPKVNAERDEKQAFYRRFLLIGGSVAAALLVALAIWKFIPRNETKNQTGPPQTGSLPATQVAAAPTPPPEPEKPPIAPQQPVEAPATPPPTVPAPTGAAAPAPTRTESTETSVTRSPTAKKRVPTILVVRDAINSLKTPPASSGDGILVVVAMSPTAS